ncbi:Rieske (2Fe-2S) iron-sulfur domain [Desulfurispirillum indicum S5]|uniref:Rieske (2Fe-2S) iron-sulfur domain n=1 Tax=Desulfurispirillum indicum (strain ATCC BAA-1389 / DSM 22839 / S5) TaxID=653733 RepID=E6W6H8_DESIS|nr:Rieske (2Fe-2S) protein [Desulfurispirillum indicum]ADU67313.1 Rieske (2Fe-2S) iron-sulfur domain [Desulfurispirillum indicum S5]
METISGKRRRFLTLALGLLTLGGIVRFLRPNIARQDVRLHVDYEPVPAGGALVYRESRVALIRNQADQVYALDLTCTHLGCTLTVTPSEIVCPCHGSRFDRSGNVLQGPAERPLRQLHVSRDAQHWTVSQ